MNATKIQSIRRKHYEGTVHNLELRGNDEIHDDLFWVCNGIVVHNCFPKDLNAIIQVAKHVDVKPTVMSAVWEKNLEIVPPEHRDWEGMLDRAVTKK